MTLFHGGQLDSDRCLSLLAQANIGRVGVVHGPVPFIYPVRYDLSKGHILFGLSIDDVATAIDDTVVSLQADGFEEDRGSHWTALAIGPATGIDTRAEHGPEFQWDERYAFRLRPKMFFGYWLDPSGRPR